MALNVIGSVGWFLARKTVDKVYTTAYHMMFGNETSNLEKKLDIILEQNEILRKEINFLKCEHEKNTKFYDETNNIVIVDDYCSTINQKKKLSKSCNINNTNKNYERLTKSDLTMYSSNKNNTNESNSNEFVKVIKVKKYNIED